MKNDTPFVRQRVAETWPERRIYIAVKVVHHKLVGPRGEMRVEYKGHLDNGVERWEVVAIQCRRRSPGGVAARSAVLEGRAEGISLDAVELQARANLAAIQDEVLTMLGAAPAPTQPRVCTSGRDPDDQKTIDLEQWLAGGQQTDGGACIAAPANAGRV